MKVGYGSDSAVAVTLAARPMYPRKLTTCCNAQVVSLGPKAETLRWRFAPTRPCRPRVLGKRRVPVNSREGDVGSLHAPIVETPLLPLRLLFRRGLREQLLRQRGGTHR
jgi:hypothetical protein